MKAILFFCLLSVSGVLSAQQVTGLYRAQVAVSSQNSSDRLAAIKTAMAQTLIKVTGMEKAPQSQALADIMADPEPFLLSYRYEQAADGLQLYALFDSKPLKNAIWQQGMPVWGEDRPTTLFWIASDDNGHRDIISDASMPTLAKAVTDEGKRRALPLLLPLWDLDDKVKLDVLDVWGHFSEPVDNASARYQAEQIVTARLSAADNGQFQVDWQLDGGLNQSGSSTGDSAATALTAMVDDVTDALAEQLAVKGQVAEQRTLLTLHRVARADDYLRALDELKSLPVVADAQVTAVAEQSVTFSLKLRGSPAQLTKALSLSQHFSSDPQGELQYQP
ncbi:DUF2066 domain-containing protein [Gallaecimonas sp. GXIMD1310]|uniref:DUF2066 domain-containing protein n=1 Tax=Gallaecimonas sp. GXIMD1310 TaxID=3131926 RepID=UPI00324991F6